MVFIYQSTEFSSQTAMIYTKLFDLTMPDVRDSVTRALEYFVHERPDWEKLQVIHWEGGGCSGGQCRMYATR